MKKTELVNVVAELTTLTKKDSAVVVDAVLAGITHGLVVDGVVTIAGFGKFEVKERAARKGRNPQNGAEIDIPASNRVAFKPLKGLKDSIE